MEQGTGDGRLVFDPALLESGRDQLQAKPEASAVTTAQQMLVPQAAFGRVPGAAGVVGRLQTWIDTARTELGHVTADVADLAQRSGQAAQMARDLDPITRAVAELGTPGGGLTDAPAPR